MDESGGYGVVTDCTENDKLRGGLGEDLMQGGGGNNTLDGGAGNNTASYANAPSGVTVNLATGTAANGYGGAGTLANIENGAGPAGQDTLIGEARDKMVTGGGGDEPPVGGGGGGRAGRSGGG